MELPSRLDVEWGMPPYRGNDTRLNYWQRMVMFFVGIGGLWFIPTFHSITKLSPFLGALCVLSVLWVVNEAFNRKLMQADQMGERKPQALQYGAIQQMLFAMGIMLSMGVLTESGVLSDIGEWSYNACFQNIWLMGALSGLLSSVVDTFTVAMTNVSFFPVGEGVFAKNGIYWLIIAFSTAMGGSLLTIGSTSGIALMRMENMRMGWYFRHLTWKVLVGFLSGLVVLYVESLFF